MSREMRRSLLLSTAERLLAERPFSRIGVRDVAAEAGMSPAAVYTYFANRAELYGFLVIEFIERMRASLVEGLADAADLEQGARVAVAVMEDEFRRLPHLFAMVVFEQREGLDRRGKELSPTTRKGLDEAMRSIYQPLAELAVNAAGLAPQDAIDLVAHFHMVASGIFLQAYKSDGMRHTSWDLAAHLDFAAASLCRNASLLASGQRPRRGDGPEDESNEPQRPGRRGRIQ
jgi:AcrR family transcriptional regulator